MFKAVRFVPAFVCLTSLIACAPKSGHGSGAITGVVSQSLTSDEAKLATDSNYISVDEKSDFTSQNFNYQTWPTGGASNQAASVGLKLVTITGLVLVIDPTQPPWLGLNGRKDLESLNIQAEKVVVRGTLLVPSTTVKISANQLVFEEAGVIDNTPIDPTGHHPFPANAKQAMNGDDGLSGQTITISVGSLTVQGSPSVIHVKANGGRGQRAGDGWGQSDAEFAKNPAHPGDMPVVPGGFPDDLGNLSGVVFVAPYIKYCDTISLPRGMSKDLARLSDPIGAERWPADGTDAIAGGAPGAGGAGGHIVINSDAKVETTAFAQANAGAAGEPDDDRNGTLGGRPNPARHVLWQHGDGCGAGTFSVQTHTQTDGQPAKAPTRSAHDSAKGTLSQNGAAVVVSPELLKLKLKRIKNLYFNQKYADTIQQVNELSDSLAMAKTAQVEVADVTIELAKIRQYLVSQKDYFGRGLHDAPTFTTEFELARYKAEVDHSLKSYYVANLFKRDFAKNQATVGEVREGLATLSDEISVAGEQIDKDDALITSIAFQEDGIKKSEQVIQDELNKIRAQLESKANRQVHDARARKQQGQIISAIGTICEVLPVYQPALGAVGAVLKASVQGPKTKDIQGWVDFGADIQKQFGTLNDPTALEQSSQSFRDFVQQFDAKNLSGKSASEKMNYLKEKYQELAPKAEQVAAALDSLKEPPVADSDIQAVLAQLEKADPMFATVKQELADLIEQKLRLQKDILTYVSLVSDLTSKISTYIAVSSGISDTALATDLVNDGQHQALFSQIADNEEQNILYLYDEAVRAYNYTALANLSHPMDVEGLRGHLDALMNRQGLTGDQAVADLSAFYDVQLSQVREALSSLVRAGSPLLMMRSNSRALSLTPAQLKQLAQTGEVDVALTKDFYNDRQNVRIKSIEVDGSNFKLVPRSAAVVNSDAEVSLRFALGDRGDFNYPGSQDYVYPSMGNFFEWEHTFQKQNGVWSSQPNNLVGEYKGLLSALVEDNSSVLQYSEIFSQHAGVTDLKIKVLHTDGNAVVKNLSVRVNYEYSSQ